MIKKSYQLISDTSPEGDLIIEGSYKECLEGLKNIKRGYICRCIDGDFIYIVKTKGMQK